METLGVVDGFDEGADLPAGVIDVRIGLAGHGQLIFAFGQAFRNVPYRIAGKRGYP